MKENTDEDRRAFEKAAKKKGYSFTRDEVGNYEDVWLQEAWEVFALIDPKELTDSVPKGRIRNPSVWDRKPCAHCSGEHHPYDGCY